MVLDRISRAWSAFYDHLLLNSELESRIFAALESPEPLPGRLSKECRALVYAPQADVTDFFRDRRDYIESIATLDLAMSVEHLIRNDLAARRNQLKISSSAVAVALLNTPNAPSQPEPATRKLLPHWKLANGADGSLIDAVDQAMQYRNWLVHGQMGPPPYQLNPFLLDEPVRHVADLIKNEP